MFYFIFFILYYPLRMFISSALPGSCYFYWCYFPCWLVVGSIGCTGGFYMLLYAWVLNSLVEVVQASGFYMLFPGDVFLWLFPLRLGGSYARWWVRSWPREDVHTRNLPLLLHCTKHKIQNTKDKIQNTKDKNQNTKREIKDTDNLILTQNTKDSKYHISSTKCKTAIEKVFDHSIIYLHIRHACSSQYLSKSTKITTNTETAMLSTSHTKNTTGSQSKTYENIGHTQNFGFLPQSSLGISEFDIVHLQRNTFYISLQCIDCVCVCICVCVSVCVCVCVFVHRESLCPECGWIVT